jgi:very-short-patch-repair endonuclease
LHVDRAAARIASAQLGNITRGQLLAIGVGIRAIDNWLARGRLIVQFRSVYALGHRSLPPLSREMAAVLACGKNALLSHASAAYVSGFRPQPRDAVVHVTVIGRHVRSRPGIRVHQVSRLQSRDCRTKHRIPITSPARTLIDIAPGLDDRELELAVHEAIATHKVSTNQLKAALLAYPRRRGTARLSRLANVGGPLTLTQAGSEEKLYRSLRKSGLPVPLTHHDVAGFEADFYWPGHRLVVEVDGVDFHSTRPKIERDHRKDIEFRKRGIDTLRFTGRQVSAELETTLVTIARELGRREP